MASGSTGFHVAPTPGGLPDSTVARINEWIKDLSAWEGPNGAQDRIMVMNSSLGDMCLGLYIVLGEKIGGENMVGVRLNPYETVASFRATEYVVSGRESEAEQQRKEDAARYIAPGRGGGLIDSEYKDDIPGDKQRCMEILNINNMQAPVVIFSRVLSYTNMYGLTRDHGMTGPTHVLYYVYGYRIGNDSFMTVNVCCASEWQVEPTVLFQGVVTDPAHMRDTIIARQEHTPQAVLNAAQCFVTGERGIQDVDPCSESFACSRCNVVVCGPI
jgi:hypothetical protein